MKALRRTAMLLTTVLCLTALTPGLALAQKSKTAEPTPEELKGYTLPYFFALIGVLAAVVAVCRPVGRKWDIAAADDEEPEA
jgi:hypothetical protein